MADYRFVSYDTIDDGLIARVFMNRPEARNAQNLGMLAELHDAFLRAEADDNVRVVIVGGHGKSFSSGHDLGTDLGRREQAEWKAQTTKKGVHAQWMREWEMYFTWTQRWRDLRKVTIAQVQGHAIAAGLLVAWACDLIVAADNAIFADVVGARLGMCGNEWFAHPWELGHRKAKELLLTGDSIDADEAHRIGMVNKVFPLETLEQDTLDFARRIARLPTAASLFIKEAVNQTQDIQGFYNSLRAAFSLHQMNHAHWAWLSNGEAIAGTPELGVSQTWSRIKNAEKSSSGSATDNGGPQRGKVLTKW